MKRILSLCICLFLSGVTQAQEPAPVPQSAESAPVKKFFLEDDGSTTLRFEKIENDVKKLKGESDTLKLRVTNLEKSLLPKLNTNTAPSAKPTVQFKTVRVQTCVNGRCTFANQLVPLTDLEMADIAAGKPVAGAASTAAGACPNCTTCANGCNCFGSGYYCADGSCPITTSTAGTTSSGSCASGSCSSSDNTGWYWGKRRGK